eukprot:Nitzschia sp. Nitz4//scaffold126_size65214//3825//7324//NITZ4_006145-RA/size65214-snap-gene-0.55-mRNA-1//-1//CDS//3329534656//6288//frame0
MAATNPFDDSFEAGPVDSSFRVSGSNPVNPFDDDPMPMNTNRTSTGSVNPFDDTTTNTNTSTNDDTDDINDLNLSPGGPVEASWQYLGDLPYRRIPVYPHAKWGTETTNSNATGSAGASTAASTSQQQQQQQLHYGLSAYPKTAFQRHHMLNPQELRELLHTSTITKVVGCAYGGPLAAVTLPIVGETSWFSHTEIRILTNAGTLLASIPFPMQGSSMERKYTPSDILEIGFTDRMALLIVLRDSLCLTYDLQGQPLLPPFHILPRGEGKGTELMSVHIFAGGVAVLSTSKHAALVEMLDDHDDPEYLSNASPSARRIYPQDIAVPPSSEDAALPHCSALVTYLPTAAFASEYFFSYTAIAVLPRTRTSSRHPEVFLATSDNSVVVVHAATCQIKDLDCRARISSPIVEMTFAPNGRFLACFTENSMLTVISTTFETKVLDFDTSEGSNQPPLQMKWCGEDSVVLHWKNLGVLMVGPYGDWLRFPYEQQGNLYLIPEMDCCRVISDASVELLQRVPPATALLLRIGSIEPSAMLLDAADAFDSGSTASNETAREITSSGMLMEAIEGCTQAAAKEFDVPTQKRLLRAASFGMHFGFKDPKEIRTIMGGSMEDLPTDTVQTMPSATTREFVATARKLRVLNAVRDPQVGMVLTSAQFDAITPSGVVARLIATKRPSLATSLCKYLALPKSVQLFARASKAAAYVISVKNRPDADVAQGAIQIIHGKSPSDPSPTTSSSMNRGGYATVAMAANKAGRPGVANLLLVLETSVADKVPALISTGSYADAIAVATTARDADFIFFTLLEYQKACGASNGDPKALQAFLSTVVSKFTPEAYNTWRLYLETQPDLKTVMSLPIRSQRFISAGVAVARKAVHQKGDFRDKLNILAESSKVFAMGKDTNVYKTFTDEYLELLKDQEVLRTKYGAAEVAPESSSVVDTVTSILKYAAVNEREQHRLLNDADKVAKKFRVPDKLHWYTKVRAFAETSQWGNMKALADSKTKPPIGFKPFARAAIAGGRNPQEVTKYIERVTVPEERFDLYCEAGLWTRALSEAFKMRDDHRLMNVKARCNSPEIQAQADQLMARLP